MEHWVLGAMKGSGRPSAAKGGKWGGDRSLDEKRGGKRGSRLPGIIDHVLRRRIVDCERDLTKMKTLHTPLDWFEETWGSAKAKASEKDAHLSGAQGATVHLRRVRGEVDQGSQYHAAVLDGGLAAVGHAHSLGTQPEGLGLFHAHGKEPHDPVECCLLPGKRARDEDPLMQHTTFSQQMTNKRHCETPGSPVRGAASPSSIQTAFDKLTRTQSAEDLSAGDAGQLPRDDALWLKIISQAAADKGRGELEHPGYAYARSSAPTLSQSHMLPPLSHVSHISLPLVSHAEQQQQQHAAASVEMLRSSRERDHLEIIALLARQAQEQQAQTALQQLLLLDELARHGHQPRRSMDPELEGMLSSGSFFPGGGAKGTAGGRVPL